MNPQAIMKLMSMKNKFQADHPRFTAFIGNLFRTGIAEGSVIEISLTTPNGETTTTNMKVNQSDLDMFQELKNLRNM